MPKIVEFYHFIKKMMACNATITLGILAHFRHFRHSLLWAALLVVRYWRGEFAFNHTQQMEDIFPDHKAARDQKQRNEGGE
jgi:hypothetical protein